MTEETAKEETTTPIVLLDFWAEWCGPCKIMHPILEEIKKDYQGRVTIREIDVDAKDEEVQHLTNTYNVMSIPTYIFLQNDTAVDQLVGAKSKEVITQKLDALLGKK